MYSSDLMYSEVLNFPLFKMRIFRVMFFIRDEHEMLVATMDMWKFRVVKVGIRALGFRLCKLAYVVGLARSMVPTSMPRHHQVCLA